MHQNNTPIKGSHPCEYCSLGAPHRFVVSICSDNQAMGAMAYRITDNSADCSAASSRKHYKLEDKISILPALCKENPPVTSGSPNKGPLMLKVYYFDRNYAENHSSGTRHFSDGLFYHYSDVIRGTVASPITSFTIVYSGKGERDQSSASLAFVRGIHWWPVKSPHKGPVTRKMFPFHDVIMWRICITGLQGIHSCLLAVSQLT